MMKRIHVWIICLALFALLAGCGVRSGGAASGGKLYTLETASGSVTGIYEGDLENGEPSGEGIFTAEDGWTFRGNFSHGFARGAVEDMPWRLSLAEGECIGSYTGDVDALTPQGQGSFLAKDGGSYTGAFAAGRPADGTAEDLPCTVLFRGETLRGRYTGPVAAGALEGEGSFLCDTGRTFAYAGGWAESAPAGAGTLTDDALFLTLGEERVRGRYAGETLDGVPEGSGSYDGRTGEDISFTYTGDWAKGLWNGQGSLIYDSELYYKRVGTFTDGVFTPDWRELLRTLGSVEPEFTLSPETEAYLEAYPELLDNSLPIPGYAESDYRQQWKRELSYEVYLKNPEEYQQNWMLFYGYTVLDRRADDTFGSEWTFTRILASNSVYVNPIECFLFGDVPGIEKMTHITFFGIPLAAGSYINSDGESIPLIVVLAGSLTGY